MFLKLGLMEHLCSGCAIFVWFIFQFKSLVCFSKPTKSTIRSWVHIFLLCLEALSQFLWTFTVLVCIFQVSSAICDTYLLVSYWCTQFAGGTICLSYNTHAQILSEWFFLRLPGLWVRWTMLGLHQVIAEFHCRDAFTHCSTEDWKALTLHLKWKTQF